MKTRRPLRDFPGGAGIFQRVFTRLGCPGRPPRFAVEFYPYANLMHTIRLRDDAACVRLSDLMRGAPLGVLEACAALLLARLYRRRVPREMRDIYREFSLKHSTRRRIHGVRRRRARRSATGPRGLHHDLAPLFRDLNRKYFGGRLSAPAMGWSLRPWRRQLGCFDPALRQIILNSRLDRAGVPRFAVEYVLYHEMLHVRHPIRRAACGLQSHSPEFRAEERRFPHYDRARRFLERLT